MWFGLVVALDESGQFEHVAAQVGVGVGVGDQAAQVQRGDGHLRRRHDLGTGHRVRVARDGRQIRQHGRHVVRPRALVLQHKWTLAVTNVRFRVRLSDRFSNPANSFLGFKLRNWNYYV